MQKSFILTDKLVLIINYYVFLLIVTFIQQILGDSGKLDHHTNDKHDNLFIPVDVCNEELSNYNMTHDVEGTILFLRKCSLVILIISDFKMI